MSKAYNRIWFPYPDAQIMAGIQAMKTHSPLAERQAKANCWYDGHQKEFLDTLTAKGIGTDDPNNQSRERII